MTDQSNTPQSQTYPPSAEVVKNAHIDAARYEEMYAASVADPEAFWAEHGKRIEWMKPFTQVKDVSWDKADLHVRWFADGTLNVTESCLDRQLETRGDKPAIIWEGDEPDDSHTLTYRQLYHAVCRFSNVLKELGVKKGDRVTLYMPMIPEAAMAMLACARLGAIHSVVFGGFASNELATRIDDVGRAAVLRETSTVFAALVGWLVLGEKVGVARAILMAVIASGALVVEFAS